MRRIERLWVVRVTLLALVAVMLAACGGSDSEPTATPQATDATVATATTAAPAATTASEPTAASTQAATATTPATPAGSATTQPEATAATAPDATATTQPSTPPTTEPVAVDAFAYGFNVFPRGDDAGAEFNDQTIELVQDAGFGWVRVQIYWRDVQQQRGWWDPLGIDRMVEQYESSGLRILASISNPPEWAIDPSGERHIADMAEWEEFVTFLAGRYAGRIHAWEIWNEQNLASTTGGTVRLFEFCEILETSYVAIKAADPEALVVFGGLTPTGVNDPSIAIDDVQYLAEFYRYDMGRYRQFFDVMGMHANATNNPPDTMWPDNPGPGDWSDHESFYFRRVEQLREVMVSNLDRRPVWITEFGWTTENQAAGYEYGADVSEKQQAEFLVRAFEIGITEWDWCSGMFVWNLNFSTVTAPEDEKHPWAVINSDWSPRPAYDALAEMPKGQ